LKKTSEKVLTGFKFPESVAYDPQAKVFYVSEFGSALKPSEKDSAGYILKMSLTGKVLEKHFLPAAGETINKPKGLWVQGNRLWTTDIDAAVIFDTQTKKMRRVELPGAKFANDPTVLGNTLYVSDSRGDQLYSVEPADFLDSSVEPKVTLVWSGKGIDPNGLYPGKDGSLLMAGFKSGDEHRGIWSMMPGQDPKEVSKPIGRLDGLYEMKDGTLLVTNWDNGSLFAYSKMGEITKLADGFKGPADLCVVFTRRGMTVVVPDLVKSEVRFIRVGM